jgi:hypothetical protein
VRGTVCLISLALILSSTVNSQAAADTKTATAMTLARELPLAIETHQIDQLSPYFDDNIRMKVNATDTEITGKKYVFLNFQWNPFRLTPKITAVIQARDQIVVIQNLPTDGISERLNPGKVSLAPRVDTFHLNSEGKIYFIESIIGDRVLHREGSY